VKRHGGDTLQDLFDHYAGSDHAVDYRELQLILNHTFSQGTFRVLIHSQMPRLMSCDLELIRDHGLYLEKTAKINVKTFQFITMCEGDMNHHEPKNSKNHFTRPS